MDERTWLTDTPARMMHHISQVAPASPRRLRLLGVAYARFLESQPDYADSKHVSHLGEDVTEGRQRLEDLLDDRMIGWGIPGGWGISHLVLTVDDGLDQAIRREIYFSGRQEDTGEVVDGPRWELARAYIFCILGNPFRPVTFAPAWRTSDVVALARGIYDERAFDRMPILADALQDAGCDSDDILNHCRADGVHACGCWVVDAVLGKA